MNKYLVSASLFAVPFLASAADYTGLSVDVTGVDAAAIAIATTLLGASAVFWAIRRILGLVG